MATPAAMARMAAIARNRVTEAGPALASALGIEWPEPAKSKDIEIQRIRDQEALADFLEAAVDKLSPKKGKKAKAAETPTEPDPPSEPTPDELIAEIDGDIPESEIVTDTDEAK